MRITPQMLDALLEANRSFYRVPGSHPPRECQECAHCLAQAAVRGSGHASAFIAEQVSLFYASGDRPPSGFTAALRQKRERENKPK